MRRHGGGRAQAHGEAETRMAQPHGTERAAVNERTEQRVGGRDGRGTSGRQHGTFTCVRPPPLWPDGYASVPSATPPTRFVPNSGESLAASSCKSFGGTNRAQILSTRFKSVRSLFQKKKTEGNKNSFY
jgi:hypothetical protein